MKCRTQGDLALEALVARAVEAAGALPGKVRVEEVGEIPAGASGKRPLVVASREGSRGGVAPSP